MWLLLVIVLSSQGIQSVNPYKAFRSEKECNAHAQEVLAKATEEKNPNVNAGCVKLEGISYS